MKEVVKIELPSMKSTKPWPEYKVEKIPGLERAFSDISFYSAFAMSGEIGEKREERWKEVARKGIRKASELFGLSDADERLLVKEWIDNKALRSKAWEAFPELKREALRLFRSRVTGKGNSKLGENVKIIIAEEESNIQGLQRIRKQLSKRGDELLPLSMAPKGHIYLDVTEIDYRTFSRAYSAIRLLRDALGISSANIRRGAPESVDEMKAMIAGMLDLAGMPKKENAESLGFKIYTEENPSGSYPLARKYIKKGREIAIKCFKLETYLKEISGFKDEVARVGGEAAEFEKWLTELFNNFES